MIPFRFLSSMELNYMTEKRVDLTMTCLQKVTSPSSAKMHVFSYNIFIEFLGQTSGATHYDNFFVEHSWSSEKCYITWNSILRIKVFLTIHHPKKCDVIDFLNFWKFTFFAVFLWWVLKALKLYFYWRSTKNTWFPGDLHLALALFLEFFF